MWICHNKSRSIIEYLETLKPTLGFNSKPIWGRIFKVKMFQVIKLLKNTEIHTIGHLKLQTDFSPIRQEMNFNFLLWITGKLVMVCTHDLKKIHFHPE